MNLKHNNYFSKNVLRKLKTNMKIIKGSSLKLKHNSKTKKNGF